MNYDLLVVEIIPLIKRQPIKIMNEE